MQCGRGGIGDLPEKEGVDVAVDGRSEQQFDRKRPSGYRVGEREAG